MKNLRWSLCFASAFVTLLIAATPISIEAWQRVSPQPHPSPNAPSDQNALDRLHGPQPTEDNGKETMDKQNQLEIRMQVQRLYAMATELKDEVDRTNSNAVMSLAILKRAHEIEKIAKQIRERAKK